MDSVSQAALGAAVCLAVAGRPAAYRRAAWWGAGLGTLPDLDVVIPYADAIESMVFHRGESHAFFFQALAAPVFAWFIRWFHRRSDVPAGGFARWMLAVFLVFSTHALLDAFTIYGTQLALPFSNHAFQIGSVFIIDPLYTLPLLLGLWLSLRKTAPRSWGNALGLLLSTAYLGWGLAAQSWVEGQVRHGLAAQGVPANAPVLVNPMPFQSLVWRVVVLHPTGQFREGVVSLLDPPSDARPVQLKSLPRGDDLLARYQAHPGVVHLQRFAQGFVAMKETGGRLELIDLRMGREGNYFFRFDLGTADEAASPSPPLARRLPRGF